MAATTAQSNDDDARPRASAPTCAIYAHSREGLHLAGRLREAHPAWDLYVAPAWLPLAAAGARPLPGPPPAAGPYAAHLHLGSTEAAVRALAPALVAAAPAAALLCVDEAARFCVGLLAGGDDDAAAATCHEVAALLGATAVPVAAPPPGALCLDDLGRSLGWRLDDAERNVARGRAALAAGAPVALVHEAGEADFWPPGAPLPAHVAYRRHLDEVPSPCPYEALLVITDREFRATRPRQWARSIIYRPRSLVLGLVCDPDTSEELVERGVAALLARARLSPRSVRAVATCAAAAAEPALRALCRRHRWPLRVVAGAAGDAATAGAATAAALAVAGAEAPLGDEQRYSEPGGGRALCFAVARLPAPGLDLAPATAAA